jgi:phospholipase/carboxylesterase
MRQQQFDGITLRIAGGTDGQGGGDGPVAIFLHGYGAGGDDLVPLGQELVTGQRFRYIFPAAPLTLAGGFMESRAWWPIDWEARERQIAECGKLDLSDEEPEGLTAVREWLIRLVSNLDTVLGSPAQQVVLGGFSQGAMLACDTALRSDLPLSGLVLLSPTLLAQKIWVEQMPKRAGLPVFMSHGTGDPVLPYAMSDRLQQLLMGAGLQMTWTAFTGAHEIPLPVIKRLGWFLDGAVTT